MIEQVNYFAIPPTSVLGIDIETTMNHGKNSDPFRDRIVSIQISDGTDVWVCTNPEGFSSLVPILETPDVVKIFHNATFDLQFLIQQLGLYNVRHIPHKESIWDSLIMERVLHAGQKVDNDLANTLARRFGVMLDKSIRTSFSDQEGPLSQTQLDYIAGDVIYLPRLREMQIKDLSAAGLGRVAGLENELTTIVARMTLTGVGFDKELWKSYIPKIHETLEEIEGWLADRLADPNNIVWRGSADNQYR